MSDCPDCDNVGWTWEWVEDPEDELSGHSYRLPCRNWRHSVRPSLEEIAYCLKRGIEPPRTHSIEKELK